MQQHADGLPALQQRVREAAWALARGGLVTAFGHCSARVSAAEFLVCAARPMGLIGPDEDGTVVPVVGQLPTGVLGEVRMHQKIYHRRPEVQAVCRFMSPHVMALAAMGQTPRARHGFSSYFYPSVPFWADPLLVRDDLRAEGVAQILDQAPAVVVGGNGAVTVAASMQRAVALAWFLEDAARVELAVRSAGGSDHRTFDSAEQAQARATWDGGIAERIWAHLSTAPSPNRKPETGVNP